tara:strand:+ start:5409 stop:5624 length:216 start_codon:yes stop_codon:yes gene_type:complete
MFNFHAAADAARTMTEKALSKKYWECIEDAKLAGDIRDAGHFTAKSPSEHMDMAGAYLSEIMTRQNLRATE